MADDLKKSSDTEIKPEVEENDSNGGGGWGGWGFSPLSYFSDLQKAATVAAEEISRNAVEATKIAAKNISDSIAEESELSEKTGKEASAVQEESDDENYELRKAAMDKLENASQETLLSHGLKIVDTSVESFASGAWQVLGSAWKGIESSALNFAESVQHGGVPGPNGYVAPSLLETGKALTAKGMQVLEQVGKETMDLFISESGIPAGKKSDGDEDHLFEDITFERCFYIYGGPEQLEELEALSNHYALLYNRRTAKLSSEAKSIYERKLKEVQNIFELGTEFDTNVAESEKGKKIEAESDDTVVEWKKLHDSSVRKAAELAAGILKILGLNKILVDGAITVSDTLHSFASALTGLAPNDIIQRTSGRLDSLHSEGVHRLSEMCCLGVTQLLMLGKFIISNATTVQQEIEEEIAKIDWPEDSVERAKIVRTKAQLMTGNIESVFNSFITGISDVAEAYLAASKGATADWQEVLPQKSVQDKASGFTEHLRADHTTALSKMQDGLQCLSYLVIATSLPAA